MADLTNIQAAQPVSLVDEATGNFASVDGSGAVKVSVSSVATSIADIQGTGNISALNEEVVITPNGYAGLGVSISGTWVGTLSFQFDNGDAVWGMDDWVDHGNSVAVSSVTSNSLLFATPAGHKRVRVIATAWTSGTATVTWNLSASSGYVEVFQPDARELKVGIYGEVTSSSPAYTNGDIRAISLDAAGNVRVTPSSSAATAPGTIGAGEALNGRSFQSTYEITLGALNAEGNVLLIKNPVGSGRKAFINIVSFGNTTGASKSTTLRVYANPTLVTPQAVTFSSAADTVIRTSHGYVNGDLVSFDSIVTTTGISTFTNYYVVGAVANNFQLSLTLGGAAINLISDGSGTIDPQGPSLTSSSMYVGGGAPVSAIKTYVEPITTSNGSKLSVATQTNEQGFIDYDWGLLLAANNTLLVTGTGTANNVPLTINVIWSEAV